MKVFLDTNVLASGLGSRGLCADVVRETIAEHELWVSEYVLEELSRVLRDKFHVPVEKTTEAVLTLRGFAVAPRSPSTECPRVRDASDVPVLQDAVAAGVDVLVTGDRDLLIVGHCGHLRIVSPRGFWEMVHAKPGQ